MGVQELTLAVNVLTVALSLAAKAAIGHQAWLNYRRKSVAGMSVPFFVIGMLSYDFYTLSGILGRNWMIFWAMSPGAVLSLVVAVQAILYRPGRR